MLDKLKALWSNGWTKLVALAALLMGFVVLLIKGKDRELAELKAQIELAKTQKEADLIDSQIRQRLLTSEDTEAKIKSLNEALEQIKEKRKTLPDEKPEDYWKNN